MVEGKVILDGTVSIHVTINFSITRIFSNAYYDGALNESGTFRKVCHWHWCMNDVSLAILEHNCLTGTFSPTLEKVTVASQSLQFYTW